MKTCKYCKEESYNTFDLGVEQIELCIKHSVIWTTQQWFTHCSPKRRWALAEKAVECIVLKELKNYRNMELTKMNIELSKSPTSLLKQLRGEK